MTLIQVAGSVWLWPHDPDPSRVQAAMGIVAGDGGSLIVDAGHSPRLASQVKAAMAEAGLPAARTLVYTHHHWDHTWGACVWGVPVVAHERCADLLAGEAARPWSHEFMRAEMARNPLLVPSYQARGRAVDDFGELRFVLPDRTFTTRLTIDGVELEHVGGRHSPDSTVVRVPSAGVLFLGDSYYPPPHHLRGPADRPDLDLVAGLVSADYEWYVESHGRPMRRTDVLTMLRG